MRAPFLSILSLLFVAPLVACSSSNSTGATSDAAADATSDATSDAANACASCAADEYCFHDWKCGGPSAKGACGSTPDCTCTCGTLPAACPDTGPCGGACGYFNLPPAGSTDKNIYCYGS
jgi:hypothetical protein